MRDFEKQRYLMNSRNNNHSPYDDLYKMQLGTRKISKSSMKHKSQINVKVADSVNASNASNPAIK
jgi:hypothetical protein